MAASRARVFRPRRAEHIVEVLGSQEPSGAGVIARGAGCSYGDAAQNGGGDVLDMTGFDRILSIDREQHRVSAQAGVTVARLMSALAQHDLMLPVLPGTRHVTLAGAVASDIHGKNHHRDGGLARHVMALSLCTPAHGLLELTPDSDPDLFYATLGGMGLTGVVTEATLRAEPLISPWVAVDTDRTAGLEQTLELLAGEERHRYSVAWLDLLASGTKMGRAVVSRADPLPLDRAPSPARGPGRRRASKARWPGKSERQRGRRSGDSYPESLLRPARLQAPRGLPGGLLSPTSVRAFNALRWRAAPRRERDRPLALTPYFFPLDALGEWHRLYGPAGLIQYQFAIPIGQETALARCFETICSRRLPVCLAVLKRFGPAFGGPLSFPIEGWTLAIDVPAAAPGLARALAELDELVAGCGGRVYLTKDVRLRAETLPSMYPQLERFHAQRARVDPDGVLHSDLSRRLKLCGAAR